mgnify:CR=1 FL=1
MQKIFLFTVATFLLFTTTNAQDFQLGAKAGINFAQINGDNTNDFDPITEFHFGMVAEVPLSDSFSFQPEVLFSGQGYSLDDDIINLDYVNIPFLAKYYVTKGLSIEAGPQLGFLVSAKNENTDVKEFFNKTDLSLNIGLGYKLGSNINFAVRYNLGLSDINDLDGFSDKYKNGVVQVSIGYFIF